MPDDPRSREGQSGEGQVSEEQGGDGRGSSGQGSSGRGDDGRNGSEASERARLRALARYDLLDTPPEPAFDRAALIARDVFDVPIALVTLLARRRQFFKACYGLGARDLPREISACSVAIELGRTLVIPDAIQDPRFVDNPLVTGAPRLRFYAGSPLRNRDGHLLGTICVLDTEPRARPEARQIAILERLADMVVDEMELRLAERRLREETLERERVRLELERTTARLASLLQSRTADLERLDAQLQHDALHDALTGLPNRALLRDRIEVAARRQRGGNDFALLHLGLDHFAVINEGLGSAVGDELLVRVAARLRSHIPVESTLARLAGDEFVVLLEDDARVGLARHVAQEIQEAFAPPFRIGGHEIHASITIGVLDGAPKPADTLLRDAEIAMYAAKARGPGAVVRFEPAMRERAAMLRTLTRDLRRAAGRGELELHYQPIVALDSEVVQGFEALVRWRHREHGVIEPGEFIPLAETIGIIGEIDRWVVARACWQLKAWNGAATRGADGALWMSVNVSGRQLADPSFPGFVRRALAEAAIDPRRLRIEITESELVRATDDVLGSLRQLQEIGVTLLIDDFGTGYSSLGYLQDLPVDHLKIDRSFVRKLPESQRSAELVRTILALARTLDLSVVAEGIETDAQADLLRELDCRYAQGFLFARPQLPDAAIATERRRRARTEERVRAEG